MLDAEKACALFAQFDLDLLLPLPRDWNYP
jgi:hypothetical protein